MHRFPCRNRSRTSRLFRAPWRWRLKSRAGALGFAAILLAWLPGCRSAPAPPVRIGVVTYRPDDLNGPSTDLGVQLAVEEVNAQGGILVGGIRRRVEVARAQTREDSPESAVAAVQKLINQDKVCAVIGPQNSDEAIPAGGIANRSGIPLISPISTHTLTTKDRPFVFRACFRDEDQGRALAEFARGTLKARSAALLVEVNVAYSRTVADVFHREFRARGGRIAAVEEFTSESRLALDQPLRRIRAAAPDVLLLPNYVTTTRLAGVAARRAGIRSIFLGPDSWSTRHLREIPEFDGSFMVTNWSPELRTARNEQFKAAYAERFRSEPTETAALTYDAASILIAAIAATPDAAPASIQRALHGLPDFLGASGRIRYTGSGDPDKDVLVLRIKDGRESLAQVVPSGAGR